MMLFNDAEIDGVLAKFPKVDFFNSEADRYRFKLSFVDMMMDSQGPDHHLLINTDFEKLDEALDLAYSAIVLRTMIFDKNDNLYLNKKHYRMFFYNFNGPELAAIDWARVKQSPQREIA